MVSSPFLSNFQYSPSFIAHMNTLAFIPFQAAVSLPLLVTGFDIYHIASEY